jgi:hypothetical protein
MKWTLFLAAASAFAQAPPTPQEAAEGWIQLFDGQTLFGWHSEGKAEWKVEGGAIVAETGEYGWLRSHVPFADFVLRVDYRQAADGNSGIFLRSAKTGAPHVTGYELQIFDTHPQFPTGSLVNHLKAIPVQPAPDLWHSYEVEAAGDRFVIKLDGKTVADGRDSKSRMGHIGLQFNKGKKIEFRNVWIKPLGAQPIFNGKNLDGWKIVTRDNVKEPPVWTAASGMIHVEKGPGQIETTAQWQDFVLQLEIRANSQDPARHPNSGVFFRGDAGGHWTGYEAQIRNEFKDGDPGQPVDIGTGGIYHHQPTRRVFARDNEFFTMTVIAAGRDIATWVNGMQTVAWTDPNPEGASVRNKQAVLKPGTMSLQAHDPTTNLDFRNLRVAGLE